MPRTSLLLALALGSCAAPGDLHVVALDDDSVTLSSATASLSAIWLDDCAGGAVQLEVVGPVELLTDAPLPLSLPAGGWCGLSLWFEDDPVAGSLVLEGLAGNTPFSIGLNPSVVVIPQEMLVDADDWVLVLEGHTLLTGRLPDAPEGLAVAPGDPLADTLTVALPDALWLGKVSEARDLIYVDLWPFPDVTFDGGGANFHRLHRGCGGEAGVRLPDADFAGSPTSTTTTTTTTGSLMTMMTTTTTTGSSTGMTPRRPATPAAAARVTVTRAARAAAATADPRPTPGAAGAAAAATAGAALAEATAATAALRAPHAAAAPTVAG
ncbi:MAG: hypothetical protein IPI35_08350 [Deltaproteobacteria bacterium]|nr:hypothetical protein [Deltaproteobacteria bacterium]